MKIHISSLLVFLSLLIFQACQEQDVPDNTVDELTQQQLDTLETFLAENNIDATKDNRLFYYRALTENPNGRSPEVGDVISFYYTIGTLDGQLIDEKKEEEAPPTKVAFGNGVIKVPVALEAALSLMKEGETYEFYLPSMTAYHDFSKPGLIPENAVIKMQIYMSEVLNLPEEKQEEDEQIQAYLTQQGLTGAEQLDSGVYYIQTEAGNGEEIINGKTVAVRYEGVLLDSTIFDHNLDSTSPVQFTIGSDPVISGFEIGLKHMQEGEKGILLIPSHAAYGASATILPRSIIGDLLSARMIPSQLGFAQEIPPYAVLRFNIEVESVN